MRYLKRYENHEDIHAICRKYGIRNYTINSDGSIDIDGDVDLTYKISEKLPLKFGDVSGDFYCRHNNLTSLEGCPESVGGDFACSDNKLTSLEGCPKSVGGHFYCGFNKIETFEGLDFINIGGGFYCVDNPIWLIWKLFEDHTKFEFFNDCDIIRENRVIILDRLNFFLDYIAKETVTGVKGYKCI
jgi:hypothetical protein